VTINEFYGKVAKKIIVELLRQNFNILIKNNLGVFFYFHYRKEMEKKKSQNLAEIFNCQKCDYITSKKCDFIKHLSTRKHSVSHDGKDLEMKKSQKVANHFFCNCGKKYGSHSGLWKHSKICSQKENIITSAKPEITSDLILAVLQQNKELQTLVMEQNKTIVDLAKNNESNVINSNNINSNNTAFNLNLFLNETCKDAMNITDFVDSLKIQMADLENVGEVGFINGISNIIVKNLKILDVTQRPVHCTDSKREVLYVKDENKWEKENQENVKIRKAIKRIAHKNSKMLLEFRKKHPDCGKSDSKYADQYNKLVIEAMGGKGDNDLEKEDKIIKNIAKEVIIQK